MLSIFFFGPAGTASAIASVTGANVENNSEGFTFKECDINVLYKKLYELEYREIGIVKTKQEADENSIEMAEKWKDKRYRIQDNCHDMVKDAMGGAGVKCPTKTCSDKHTTGSSIGSFAADCLIILPKVLPHGSDGFTPGMPANLANPIGAPNGIDRTSSPRNSFPEFCKENDIKPVTIPKPKK